VQELEKALGIKMKQKTL